MRYRSLLAAAVGLSFLTPAAATTDTGRLLLAQAEPKSKEEEESRSKSRRDDRQKQQRQGQDRQGQDQDRQDRQSQDRQDRQERQGQDRQDRRQEDSKREAERERERDRDRDARKAAEDKAKTERDAERAKRETERDRERDARKAAEDKAKAERDAERAKREAERDRERDARKAAEDKTKAERDKAAADERDKQKQTRDRDGRDRDDRDRQTRDRDGRDRDDRDRDRQQTRDRDRDRDGRDRDDRDRRAGDRRDDDDVRRYRERVREREERKTSIRELTNIQIRDGRITIDGGRRTLYRQGDRVYIRGNDFDRLRWGRGDERVERLPDGRRRIIVFRPDGTQIITIVGPRGEIIRRVRRDRGGREYVLIREIERAPLMRIDLGPLRLSIPREHYIVDARSASRRDFERALWAPPVEPVERIYSIEEVLTHERVRDIMPRIDLSTITFETDSAVIADDQLESLDIIADIILDMIEKNPAEQILVEGHTDGVGDETYNLALSDRRAESVAIALSEYYDIPPENLITQGYGETQLKIPTDGPERENRRVAFRRITPLVSEYGRR